MARVTTRSALWTWAPVVAWMAVIFAFSSVPSLSSGFSFDYVLRKCAHMTEYAVLAVLLVRALGREAPSFALGVAYAASDEIHQMFVPNRFADITDVVSDAIGAGTGLLALHFGHRLLYRRSVL